MTMHVSCPEYPVVSGLSLIQICYIAKDFKRYFTTTPFLIQSFMGYSIVCCCGSHIAWHYLELFL